MYRFISFHVDRISQYVVVWERDRLLIILMVVLFDLSSYFSGSRLFWLPRQSKQGATLVPASGSK